MMMTNVLMILVMKKLVVYTMIMTVTTITNVRSIYVTQLRDVIMIMLYVMIILASLMISVVLKLGATTFLSLFAMIQMLVQQIAEMLQLVNAIIPLSVVTITTHVPLIPVTLHLAVNIVTLNVMIITHVPLIPATSQLAVYMRTLPLRVKLITNVIKTIVILLLVAPMI
jgi:hypothetical protein